MFNPGSLSRLLYEAALPSSFFKDASYEAVVTDMALRSYLAERLNLPSTAAPADSQTAVLMEAERRRGSTLWIRLYGVPYEYPASEDDHRLANLLERIYLSAPGNYNKKPLFKDHLMSQTRREEIIDEVSLRLGAGGFGAVGLVSAICWVISRRKRQAQTRGPLSA